MCSAIAGSESYCNTGLFTYNRQLVLIWEEFPALVQRADVFVISNLVISFVLNFKRKRC